ncbi:M12 family metallo-peptidase, partial [Verrucomicrobiales bacterium]|nr:M12 family metallo-peptidase [Verrucomicrobiales bacterium]
MGALVLVGVALAQKSQTVSPDGVWEKEDFNLRKGADESTHSVFRVDWAALEQVLSTAPSEEFARAKKSASLTLPMPDGSYESFDVFESPVMAPALAAKFPEIKTYAGTGTGKNRGASVRISVTPAGINAQVLSTAGGAVYLDPMSKDSSDLCVVYRKANAIASEHHAHCLVSEGSKQRSIAPFIKGAPTKSTVSRPSSGTVLRTYRLAAAATGEYTAFHGGSVSAGMAAIVQAINRVTGVYETELSIRFQLVANNDLLIYTNSSTDPYTNNDGVALLGENQSNVDSIIGNANYDIGHVFSTGGGGIAGLGVVGRTGSKARGVTGLGSPIGDPFFIDFVAHEIGHQFRGNHTFNGDSGSCAGGNRNGATAYEPGSGTTIQAYAGICSNDNLQNNSDPYFHFESFDEMTDYVDLSIPNVGIRTSTNNSPPDVDAGPEFTIPARTPFVLTASATDPDGNAITYCWEERDLGAQQDVSAGDNGSSPIFRSFSPTAEPSRTFPRLSDLLANRTVIGETLPTTTRDLDFRVTARDNQPLGGGVRWDDTSINVIDTGEAFRVTAPNTAVTWSSGSEETVSWDVAGTTANGINAASVDITLSTDGGLTYPISLASEVPNDGSQQVIVPIVGETSSARVRVQATGGIFFDISDRNFSIENTNGFSLTVAPPSREACDASVATYQVSAPNFSGSAITLAASDLPPSATAEISPNPLPPGETAILTITTFSSTPAGDFDVTITGSAAGSSGGQSLANVLVFTEPPAIPSLTAPENGAAGVSREPTFFWEDSPDATRYTLEISEDDPSFAAPLIVSVGDANFTRFFLPPSATIYWRIGAANACGT